MVLKYTSASLEQCKNTASMVFEVTHRQEKHAVCVCSLHGRGRHSVLEPDDQRYPPLQQARTLVVEDAVPTILGMYHRYLVITADRAHEYTSEADWAAVQKQLDREAKEERYQCAKGGCTRAPTRFYITYGDDMAFPSGTTRVLCVCGRCDGALKTSAEWKLLYKKKKRSEVQGAEEQTNLAAFVEWANNAPRQIA